MDELLPSFTLPTTDALGANKGIAAQLRALPLERLQCLVCGYCKIQIAQSVHGAY